MRKWLYEQAVAALTANATYADVAGRVLSVSSLGVADTPSPARPFVVIRAGLRTPEPMPDVRNRLSRWPYAMWAHDNPGTLTRVDDILKIFRDWLATVTYPDLTPEGHRVLDCRWSGESEDLVDDGFVTATRWTEYELVTKEG